VKRYEEKEERGERKRDSKENKVREVGRSKERVKKR